MSEVISIKAHYDGENIVPDEPLDVPTNYPLRIDIWTDKTSGVTHAEIIVRQLQGLRTLQKLGVNDPHIPVDQLSRNLIYDDPEV